MTTTTQPAHTGPASSLHKNRWRIIGWGVAAALILTPLIAMQFTSEVHWTGSDFVFAIIIFGGIGLLLELAVRMSPNPYYRAGAAFALLSAFLIVWANGAVGMIGNEDNPVNMLFGLAILTAITGVILTRFRAPGIAYAMFAAGAVQASIATIAGIFGTDLRGDVFSLVLAGTWMISGALFKGVKV